MKRREPAALGELYDRYGKLAYNVILRIVSDGEKAEDLLAETFVMVWNQIERWDDARAEDLLLWLLLLARDHALEYLRTNNQPLPKALPRPTALTQPNVLEEFPRPKDFEQWIRLQNAFLALSERELRILEMACFDGMTTAEIAVNLGESVEAIKETVQEALEKLSG